MAMTPKEVKRQALARVTSQVDKWIKTIDEALVAHGEPAKSFSFQFDEPDNLTRERVISAFRHVGWSVKESGKDLILKEPNLYPYSDR
jgi:hypothetical protein